MGTNNLVRDRDEVTEEDDVLVQLNELDFVGGGIEVSVEVRGRVCVKVKEGLDDNERELVYMTFPNIQLFFLKCDVRVQNGVAGGFGLVSRETRSATSC